ncbi:MAG: NAD-dependent epimerase/dehydratase family protein [Chloroflexota bacterium]
MKDVLVTGANGHVGYTLVEMLVERGYRVRAGMRNAGDARKSEHLRALGVELVELDITRPEQIRAAVEGMAGIFHVAAVFQIAGDPQAIIRPTVEGAMNIVRAAHHAGVQKIIYTSSGRALGNSSPPGKPLDENSWNTRARVPYSIAKTQAEQQVWQYAHQHQLDLIAILPLLILGPNIHRLSESTAVVDNILHGRYPVIPPIAVNIVDVRDVALAHLLAYENPQANGRYIVGNEPVDLKEVFALVNEFQTVKIPALQLPKNAFVLYTDLTAWLAGLRGKNPQITPAQAREMTEGRRYVDISKTEGELGMKLRSTREAIGATVNWLQTHKIQ